jgi:hypothetical protein
MVLKSSRRMGSFGPWTEPKVELDLAFGDLVGDGPGEPIELGDDQGAVATTGDELAKA